MTGRLRGWIVPLLLLGTMAYALAEEITLTTYYPSPRGVYDQLRTAGNVQIGKIDPPALGDPVPRLHVVQGDDAPALRVDDQAPVGPTLDDSPFLIDANGNVGIGTTGPLQAKLDVVGGIKVGNIPTTGSPPPQAGTIRWNGSSLQVFKAGDWVDLATGGGGVGGSGTPGYLPQWGADGSSLTNSMFQQNSAGTMLIFPNPLWGLKAERASSFSIVNDSSGNFYDSTITRQLTIGWSGNIGIGTATPTSAKGSPGYLDVRDVWLRDVSAWVSELTRNALFGGYQLWFNSSGTPTACRLNWGVGSCSGTTGSCPSGYTSRTIVSAHDVLGAGETWCGPGLTECHVNAYGCVKN